MKETLEAVYENGVFRPLRPPEGVAEQDRVTLVVTSGPGGAVSLADLPGQLPLEDAAEMEAIINREFEQVDLSEWSTRCSGHERGHRHHGRQLRQPL